ncbi:hypothetical protein EVAR_102900_1 [Eumeta japonica]|uniref:Uncharacterized protein n=1 Tax=Eumeta variegata TaxID=151549 RepID=A0A4C1ZQG7_EUMVA|nr:hypothetical protein EVAR_102900_1 [Eumeta japonica]
MSTFELATHKYTSHTGAQPYQFEKSRRLESARTVWSVAADSRCSTWDSLEQKLTSGAAADSRDKCWSRSDPRRTKAGAVIADLLLCRVRKLPYFYRISREAHKEEVSREVPHARLY